MKVTPYHTEFCRTRQGTVRCTTTMTIVRTASASSQGIERAGQAARSVARNASDAANIRDAER